MRVEVTKTFKWCPDGNHVVDAKVGEVLEGKGAAIALELQSGRELSASEPPPEEPKVSDTKSPDAAPENAAVPAAPRRRGR